MIINKTYIKNILFLLFFSLQISIIISDTEIKLKYDDYNRPYSSVCFGSKSFCLSLRVDTDYIDTLVHSSSSKKDIKNKYDISASKKSSAVKNDVEITYNSKKLKSDYVRDTLIIDSLEIKKGLFYSIKEGDCEDIDKIEGILGLGLASTANQEKNSVMTQLYVGGYLDSKIWTMDLSDKKNGYIKADKNIDSKSVGTDLDLINNEEGHWLIKIKYILLGKNINKDSKIEFDNDSQIKISTSEIKSSVNLGILKLLSVSYFKPLLDNSECKLDTKGKYTTYFCKNNNYEQLGNISLIFNDFGINIPKENILIKNNDEYEFILSNYDGEKNNVLGIDLLKGKKLVFDCEKMKLGIYGENMFDTTKVTESEEEKPKEDDPIIPSDKDDEKEKDKDKDKDKEKDKDKDKDKNKDKEEEKKKEEKKEENEKINDENQNQNQDNNDKKEDLINNEVKSSSSIFKKIAIFITIAIVLFICWSLFKRYKRRKAKNKFPFKSYNDINLNGIQLISD